MIISGHSDQEFLASHASRIREFLTAGKVIQFSGQLFRRWLPGGSTFVAVDIDTYLDYSVRIVAAHPVFEGVEAADLTFRRRVAGFFARGYHPPPPGAQIFMTLASGEPIVYQDTISTSGTILVHAGTDLLSYVSPETSPGKIVPNLLEWIRDEHERLQRGGDS